MFIEVKMNNRDLRDVANVLRRDVLKMTTNAESGHPTSCMSCAEIVSCLFFSEMKYDVRDHNNHNNDEFILSKGHAAPILYSALSRAGAVSGNLMSLRKFGSKFEGHPIPSSVNWVKVATGSLGQGLSVGVGMALAAKLDGRSFNTYVLLGDSEMAEGSNYEAMQLASHYNLNNLIAIVDINRLGQRGETMLGHDISTYKKRFKSFGWKVVVVDGHDVSQIVSSLRKKSKLPKVILAKTFKGKGFSHVENKEGWHGEALSEVELQLALRRMPDPVMPKIDIRRPDRVRIRSLKTKLPNFTTYSGKLATRKAYGNILASLAKADHRVLALDGEVSNSTFAEKVKEVKPNQFVECFIAEQNMIGMALGLSKKGFNVFASTFAAFLSRAHDQLRIAALSSPDFTVCGSHAGVSIGQDGGSQMGLEDIAIFRSLPKSIVLYPSDAVSCEKLVVLASRTKGLKYIRTTRADTSIIYSRKESFNIGDFKVLKSGKIIGTADKSAVGHIILVGSGITLHECLKAAEKVKGVSVVDLYCVKPFDGKKFIDFVKKHGKKVVVVEDHYEEGGIGEMLSSVLNGTGIKMKHLAVRKIPHSGRPEELLRAYGIDSDSIVGAVNGGW